MERRVLSQITENWIAFRSIYSSLWEKGKINSELGHYSLLDFSIVPRLLSHELVTWEGENFESLSLIIFIKFNHLTIVIRSQTSLTCNIYNHQTFFILKFTHLSHISINIWIFEIEECLSCRLHKFFRIRLKDYFLCNFSYSVSHPLKYIYI